MMMKIMTDPSRILMYSPIIASIITTLVVLLAAKAITAIKKHIKDDRDLFVKVCGYHEKDMDKNFDEIEEQFKIEHKKKIKIFRLERCKGKYDIIVIHKDQVISHHYYSVKDSLRYCIDPCKADVSWEKFKADIMSEIMKRKEEKK